MNQLDITLFREGLHICQTKEGVCKIETLSVFAQPTFNSTYTHPAMRFKAALINLGLNEQSACQVVRAFLEGKMSAFRFDLS